MTWAAALCRYLMRRYSDAHSLRRLIDLELGVELASTLSAEGSAQNLAYDVVARTRDRGQLGELLVVLQQDAAGRGDELEPIVRDFLAEHDDPKLAGSLAAYGEHARRVARRPPLEALIGKLLDVPDFDLEQVFIPPIARPVPPSRTPGEAETKTQSAPAPSSLPDTSISALDLWPARAPWLVLLGEPGAGKSVLTQRLTVEMLRASTQVPVRIELRRYAAWAARRTAQRDFLTFLGDAHGEDGIPLSAEQLRRCALAGRIAWLIDGLDEVSDPELRFACAARVANLRHLGGTALISSRPRGVTRELDFLREAGLAIHELCPFDDHQLDALGQRWLGAGFLDDLALRRVHDATAVRELMRTPLVATLIFVLARRGALPRQRQRLLAEISALTVRRWAERRGPLTLDASGRTAFLRRLAWAMLTEVERGADNIIRREPLLRIAARFFQERDDLARDEAHARASTLIDELGTDVDALAPLGVDGFGFVHRSLLEFFAADALAEARDAHKRCARFASDWRTGAWSEVLAMTCGLLADRDTQVAALAVRGVFTTCTPLDSAGLLAASEFAVRCLAEVAVLDRPLDSLCVALTELWLSLGGVMGLDMRNLAAALRTIGPRWPGASLLQRWLRTSHGRGMMHFIPEYGPQFSSGESRWTEVISLALAVAPAGTRPEILELLATTSAFDSRFADILAAMGPWSPAELAVLATTVGRNGPEWDTTVLRWMGDIAGSDLERWLKDLLELPDPWTLDPLSAATMLLASSVSRTEAAHALDALVVGSGQEPVFPLLDPRSRLVRVLRLDRAMAIELCRIFASARAISLRAIANLVLADYGDATAAAALVEMLRSTDRAANVAANAALAHGLRDGIERVLDLLDGDPSCLTVVWAVSICAHFAELSGRRALARTLWCHLADAGDWGESMRWMATAALLRSPTSRDLGLERLRRLRPERPPNSPNFDTALRALAEHPDGPDRLRELLQAETDRTRSSWLAQVLLERVPGDALARQVLVQQAATSTDRQEQHLLAHAMRRVGLPRDDWADVARKISSHVHDPISWCATAVLLGDCEALGHLADGRAPTGEPVPDEWGPPVEGLSQFAALLLRCEELRLRIVDGS